MSHAEGDVGSSSALVDDLWKRFWDLDVPNKIKHFLWRCFHSILPCSHNPFSKRLLHSPVCGCCDHYPESVIHTLVLSSSKGSLASLSSLLSG